MDWFPLDIKIWLELAEDAVKSWSNIQYVMKRKELWKLVIWEEGDIIDLWILMKVKHKGKSCTKKSNVSEGRSTHHIYNVQIS